jgi:hypothetical protein
LAYQAAFECWLAIRATRSSTCDPSKVTGPTWARLSRYWFAFGGLG